MVTGGGLVRPHQGRSAETVQSPGGREVAASYEVATRSGTVKRLCRTGGLLMSLNLDYALQLIGRGPEWTIFPLSGFKKPFKGSHGFKDASNDRAVVERWYTEKPYANIG